RRADPRRARHGGEAASAGACWRESGRPAPPNPRRCARPARDVRAVRDDARGRAPARSERDWRIRSVLDPRLAVGITAFLTGYLATICGLRPVPFYLGIGYAVAGL